MISETIKGETRSETKTWKIIFIYTMFIDFSPALRRCFINQMIRKNCVSQKTFEKRVAEYSKANVASSGASIATGELEFNDDF